MKQFVFVDAWWGLTFFVLLSCHLVIILDLFCTDVFNYSVAVVETIPPVLGDGISGSGAH